MATLKIGGIVSSTEQEAALREQMGLGTAITLTTEVLKNGVALSAEDKAAFRASVEVMRTIKLTQAAYDALSPPDENTLYVIAG